MANNYDALAKDILDAVGGADNITSVSHCITRLRFYLKDESIPKDEEIKAMAGVAGVLHSAGQYQIIIGQTVDKVYDALCSVGHIENQDVKEELQQETAKEKLTWKKVGSNILDALSGCLTPLIPMLIAAAIFKTLVAILGPDMLGVLSDSSDLYTLFTFVGDAGFYFFPVIVGYTAAKKFKVTPVLGMFLGAIMLHPTFVDIATNATPFTVFGIPCSTQNYSATIIPIILSVWIMSYVEKFFNKVVPSFLKIVFAPVLTIFVILPISLCLLGPAGAFLGNYICNGLLALGDFGGIFTIIAIGLIGALWEFLVISGMHWVLISTLIVVISSAGQENVVSAATAAASFAVGGMCLGAFLRQRSKEDKSLSLSYVISAAIAFVVAAIVTYVIGLEKKDKKQA